MIDLPNLSGRVALVTGSGRNIGRATVLQLARKSQVVLDLPEDALVGELAVAEVARQYPGLTQRPETMVVAVNQEYRDHSFVLSDGDEAALIPPVSGGAG